MSVAYGEQQRHTAFGDTRFGAPAPAAAPSQRDLERQYHVVLQDSLGHPALGFRDGTWFRLTVSGPQALQLRGAIRHCPHAAGSIVQIACWWMRENPLQPRSLDLATELALTVGELVRACPADGLGSSASDLLAMPPAPMQAAIPVAQPLPVAASPQPAFAAPMAAAPMPASSIASTPAPATTGSWFDPTDTTGTGGFPAIPPAPVMGQPRAAAPATNPMPHYQQARTPYPPAPQGYGSAAQPQAALPAAGAPRPAAPRGYGEQTSDWDRPAAPAPAPSPRRAAPPQPAQPAPAPRPAAPRGMPNGTPVNGGGVNGTGLNGSGPQPRPRPQQPRPEFRDERRDTFEGSRGADPGRSSDRLDRSSDRLDRSGDRLDPRAANGVPPRRPAPRQQQRGTMGQRPATRPGRPPSSSSSDW